MTQEQRNTLKKLWFRNCDNIREIQMPNDAKFFVGQIVVHCDCVYEIIGYYDYYGSLQHYLCFQYEGYVPGSLSGVPFTVQDEMYLKSEEHLHKKAKILPIKAYGIRN